MNDTVRLITIGSVIVASMIGISYVRLKMGKRYDEWWNELYEKSILMRFICQSIIYLTGAAIALLAICIVIGIIITWPLYTLLFAILVAVWANTSAVRSTRKGN